MQTIDQSNAIINTTGAIESKRYDQKYGQSNQNNIINNLAGAI